MITPDKGEKVMHSADFDLGIPISASKRRLL